MNDAITNPLMKVMTIITMFMSGFFMGRVGNQNSPIESQLSFYPNIETVGVVLSGPVLPKTAQLMYRQSGQTDWREGHPLFCIDDGRLVGSLFWLSAATSYEVKVLSGATEISGSVTTQPNELSFTPSTIGMPSN